MYLVSLVCACLPPNTPCPSDASATKQDDAAPQAVASSTSASPPSPPAPSGYTTPKAFMDLFFEFSGRRQPDFPKTKTPIGLLLAQSEQTATQSGPASGPLVVVSASGIYVYAMADGKLLGTATFRASRSSGFFEMTAVSHIGPAVSYLAQIKANGDARWKPALESLLKSIRAVRQLNAATEEHWLDRLDPPAWRSHKANIRNMVDYACAKAGNYLYSVRDGKNLSLESVQQDFLSGTSEQFPISYNAIMIGTFMLDAIEGAYKVYEALSPANINWSQAMVIVRSEAGSNYSAGLTKRTNWLVALVRALSNNSLPDDRIIIAPYAQPRQSLGQAILPQADLNYYAQAVWGQLYYRGPLAKKVFSDIKDIELNARPALPGDYGYTKADNIDDFMIRLKHSLADGREMLSNTIGFWVPLELQSKSWDPAAIDIPGLTVGLPAGVNGYPATSPAIPGD